MARVTGGDRRTWAAALMTVVGFAATSVCPALATSDPRPALALPDAARQGLPATALADGPGQQRVIDAVEKRYNAKVVRVTETTVNGKPALELRLLSDQRVWNVVVDAETGQELSRS